MMVQKAGNCFQQQMILPVLQLKPASAFLLALAISVRKKKRSSFDDALKICIDAYKARCNAALHPPRMFLVLLLLQA